MIVLQNGRLLDAVRQVDEPADVVIDGGVVVAVNQPHASPATDADTVVDCTGLWITAGFVDLHTHVREPGYEEAEDVATASQAAAHGGYTAVCPMANTDPVCDSAAVAELVWRRARDVGLVDMFPVGSITKGQAGAELTEFGELHDCAAGVDFFSDDGIPLANSLVMRRALQYATAFDAVICNHAQDPALTVGAQMHEGAVSSVLGLPGWPHEAEEIMIARDLILADGAGARLHVPHVSTAGSVELIRLAKERGINVTAEVTPHHLVLTDELVASYDPVFKVNPPVRNQRDVEAVREALADGTIDVVATDHAPHAPEDKDQEWEYAPCGMLGLETAFAVINTVMINGGYLDPLTAVHRLNAAPAQVRNVGDHGLPIDVGLPANVTVVDPNVSWEVHRSDLHSRAHNSPYLGRTLQGRPVHTLLRGRFTLRDGNLVQEQPA